GGWVLRAARGVGYVCNRIVAGPVEIASETRVTELAEQFGGMRPDLRLGVDERANGVSGGVGPADRGDGLDRRSANRRVEHREILDEPRGSELRQDVDCGSSEMAGRT